MAPEDYEPTGAVTITYSRLINVSEQRRDNTFALILFRLDLRPRFWLSRGGPFFPVFDFGERHRHHAPSAEVPVGTVLTLDNTGRLINHCGKGAGRVCASVHPPLPPKHNYL